MHWNKHFKTVCIACMPAMLLSGCGSSPYTEPSQNAPAAELSLTADEASGHTAQTSAADTGNSYITIDEAKSFVLANAGVTEENVRFVRLKLVSENGGGKYDIEFVSDTVQYDYMVDALTGEILSMNCEMGNYDIDNMPSDIAQAKLSPAEGSQDTGQQEENGQAGNQQDTANQTGNGQNEGSRNSNSQNRPDDQYIGREAAQQAALAHAGLDADAVHFAHTHLEFDDGRWKYDVEFHKGNEEYDYDIDALTGEILSYDYDAEYINPGTSAAQGGEYITQEKAKQIALAHAGISESDAQYMKVEFDYDDGRAEYEVEWNVGWMEYSCDVDACTGEILSFDKELD